MVRMERIARVVRSEERIVLEGIRIRRIGMVCASLARRSSQDDILQLVVGQEEVAEASLEDCNLSGWVMEEQIGNEGHPFVARVVGSGNFRSYWIHVLYLVKGICGLLRGSPFLTLWIAWTVFCPFLLIFPTPICGQPWLVVEGMMSVVVAASRWVVDVSAVVVR